MGLVVVVVEVVVDPVPVVVDPVVVDVVVVVVVVVVVDVDEVVEAVVVTIADVYGAHIVSKLAMDSYSKFGFDMPLNPWRHIVIPGA